MDRRWVLAVLGVFLTAPLVPVAAAQAPPGSPYEGCSENPQTCDPVAANGGVVRAGDDPVRVILFAHATHDAPIVGWILNVDPPAPAQAGIHSPRFMPTLYVDHEEAPCCKFRNNAFEMVFTPSPVVKRDDGNWHADVHRMVVYDVPIVGEYMQVFVYVSPEGVPAADAVVPGPFNGTGVVPNLGLYARAHSAFDLDHPRTIAEGDTGGYGDVPPPTDAGMTMISRPGEDPVYELRVFMPVEYPWLHGPHEERPQPPGAWGLGIDGVVYQVDGNGQVAYTDNGWRFRSGPEYPPRVVFDTTRVLRFEDRAIAPLADRGYAFNWTVRGAFGSLDVDEATAEIVVDGPVSFVPELVAVEKSTLREGMTAPVTLWWRTPEAMERVPDGTYRIQASVRTSQGTYELAWEEGFTVKNGAPVPSDTAVFEGSAHAPAPSAALGLLGLLGVAIVRVRRR